MKRIQLIAEQLKVFRQQHDRFRSAVGSEPCGSFDSPALSHRGLRLNSHPASGRWLLTWRWLVTVVMILLFDSSQIGAAANDDADFIGRVYTNKSGARLP